MHCTALLLLRVANYWARAAPAVELKTEKKTLWNWKVLSSLCTLKKEIILSIVTAASAYLVISGVSYFSLTDKPCALIQSRMQFIILLLFCFCSVLMCLPQWRWKSKKFEGPLEIYCPFVILHWTVLFFMPAKSEGPPPPALHSFFRHPCK